MSTIQLLRRACEQLGLAFSENRVTPGLAEFRRNPTNQGVLRELNSLGRDLGIRFREMNGSFRELTNIVADSGPIVLFPGEIGQSSSDDAILVLKVTNRDQFHIFHEGEDRVVNARWFKKFQRNTGGSAYQWLLIQPIFVLDHASRFHYQQMQSGEPLRPLRRLAAMLKPEAKDIRTILIFSVITGLLSLTTPLAVEAVVNTIAFGRYLQPLIVLSLIVLVFLGFRAGLNVLMTIVTEVIQRRLFVRAVEDISYRLTRVPISVWNKYHGPELVNRFFDIVNIQKVTSKLLLESLMLLLQTLIGLSVLAFYHPFLLGYDVGLLAMMTVMLFMIGRGAVKTAQQESQSKYETAAWLQEVARHPFLFKFNGGFRYAINRADELSARYIQNRQSHFRILIGQITFAMVMQVIAATVLLALGGYLVIAGQMTLGQLVAAELIVTVILGSFAKLGKDLESFYDLLASVDKLGKIFDLPVEVGNSLTTLRRTGPIEVSVMDYTLSAGQTPANIVFRAGGNYVIAGSGELKRRKFLETLLGQAVPSSGSILLDGFPVDGLNVESVDVRLGWVRNIEIFEGTVEENIRLGRELASPGDFQHVLDLSGLRESITSWENGIETRLKISGHPLSPGEAIRLMLARALIGNPGVLIIDGLLDRLSDADTLDVLERLKSCKDDVTLIISTGRKAIIEWADEKLDMSRSIWALTDFDG